MITKDLMNDLKKPQPVPAANPAGHRADMDTTNKLIVWLKVCLSLTVTLMVIGATFTFIVAFQATRAELNYVTNQTTIAGICESMEESK